MKKLNVRKIKTNNGDFNFYDDGEPVVWENSKYRNPTYQNIDGKRRKTRNYNQWTSMTNRCLAEGQHKKNYPTYLLATCSETFKNFDSWVDWAEKQVGYMCEDKNGNLYQLDKDFISETSHYSEDTCLFVPPYINGFHKNTSPTSKYEFMCRFLDEDFSTLDERALDFIFSRIGFGASLIERIDESMVMSKSDAILKGRVAGMLGNFDKSDVMTGVKFVDGFYTYVFNLFGVSVRSAKFSDVKDCVLHKYAKMKEILVEVIEKENHVFTTEGCNTLLEKINLVVEDINSGSVKFKKYVLVDY